MSTVSIMVDTFQTAQTTAGAGFTTIVSSGRPGDVSGLDDYTIYLTIEAIGRCSNGDRRNVVRHAILEGVNGVPSIIWQSATDNTGTGLLPSGSIQITTDGTGDGLQIYGQASSGALGPTIDWAMRITGRFYQP